MDADQEAAAREQVELPEVEGTQRVVRWHRLVGDDHVVALVGVDLWSLTALAEVLDG